MTECMLMFSIGPVQTFIAQARKTRDLWLGSFLLSVLMEAAMADLPEEELVFPATPKIKGKISDLPNKYVAIFSTKEKAQNAVRQSELHIKECWESICEDVWNRTIKIGNKQDEEEAQKTWKRQVNTDTLFEIYWVIVEKNNLAYPQWLERTQTALDGRKRLRDFKQLYNVDNHGTKILVNETGEKSTISGNREALHGKGTAREAVRSFWKNLAQSLQESDINKKGEERLDAIDIVKRFAFKSEKLKEQLLSEEAGRKYVDAGFPSTSSIATAPFVESLLRNPPEALEGWLTITGDYPALHNMSPRTIPYLYERAGIYQEILKRDGDCYFPETFTPHRLEKDYGFLDNKKEDRTKLAQNGTKALIALLQAAKETARPTPYYAMLQLDGDNMGTFLSEVEDPKEHKEISKALSNYSRTSVPDLVEKQYPGRVVYAGGDDVFALVPLEHATPKEQADKQESTFIPNILKLADLLQQQYCEQVKAAVNDQSRKAKVSASMGIAIAHHYTSLSYVRRVSKQAEDDAKKHYGRNALVISVIRRSGEQTRVGCHWRYPELDEQEQPIELFTRFYELFKNAILSPKCVYTLLEEAPFLIGMDERAQQSEIKRTLLRQLTVNDMQQQKDLKGEMDRLAQYLVTLAAAMDNDKKGARTLVEKRVLELHSEQRRRGLVEVFGWLLVMVFLTRKGQD